MLKPAQAFSARRCQSDKRPADGDLAGFYFPQQAQAIRNLNNGNRQR